MGSRKGRIWQLQTQSVSEKIPNTTIISVSDFIQLVVNFTAYKTGIFRLD